MNLISCAKCGVVLDKNRLVFPTLYNEVIEELDTGAVWTGYTYVGTVPCPVCKWQISEEE